MPRKDILFGFFGLSYYESDYKVQYNQIKKELSEYKDFLYGLKSRWKDEKQKAFFKKHINDCTEAAESYLFHCEKLIKYLEEAREITIDYGK